MARGMSELLEYESEESGKVAGTDFNSHQRGQSVLIRCTLPADVCLPLLSVLPRRMGAVNRHHSTGVTTGQKRDETLSSQDHLPMTVSAVMEEASGLFSDAPQRTGTRRKARSCSRVDAFSGAVNWISSFRLELTFGLETISMQTSAHGEVSAADKDCSTKDHIRGPNINPGTTRMNSLVPLGTGGGSIER